MKRDFPLEYQRQTCGLLVCLATANSSTPVFPLQDEKKLLEAVREGENKLLELKNQLLSKKSQVAAVKAELDQKTQTLQDIDK